MMDFPFQLPKSLSGYIESFVNDPDKTIEKLDAHLKKRGYDAVGYFLLSWFYLNKDNKAKAIEYALVAKTYAPGSPFLEYLHYFFTHPDAFAAFVPKDVSRDGKKIKKSISVTNFLIDLETLISRISQIEGQKISLKTTSENEDIDLSIQSIDIDDLATETLANIHAMQGNTENAVLIYKRLIEKEPSKKDYFETKISDLKGK